MTTIQLLTTHRTSTVALLSRRGALQQSKASGFSTAIARRSWNNHNNSRLVLPTQQHVPFLRRDDEKKQQHSSTTQQYTIALNVRSFATLNRHNTTNSNTNHHHDENENDTTISQRARAGMSKARHGYQKRAKRTKALAKAGAASSIEKLKQYGPVFAGTYAALYVCTLASLYGGIDSGLIDPATILSSGETVESKNTAALMIDYLNHYEWTKPAVPFFEKNPHFANLGVAWVATKVTEPFRLVIAMVVVPRLANYLGYVPQAIAEEEVEEEFVDEVVGEEVSESSSEKAKKQ